MTEPTPPILLVEDGPDDIFFMQEAFMKLEHGGPVQVVTDGLQAVRYLEGKGDYADRARFPLPGLVLLDLKLPKLTGLEVLAWKRDRAELAGIPVLVLTSSAEHRDVQRAYELGAFSYHVKPVDFQRLIGLAADIRRFWLDWVEGGIPKVHRPLPGSQPRHQS